MDKAGKRSILDVDVVELDWPAALAFAASAADSERQSVFAFLNANNANLAMRDGAFRKVLQEAVVLPDGIGVDIASRAFYGKAFPANLNGTDFVPALLTYITTPKRVALIGAGPDVFERVTADFARHAPWHTFIPIADGFFDRRSSGEILGRLAEARPDILLVAMGSPGQEIWVHENIEARHGRLVITVGALFDFVSGSVPRAPERLRALRLEWAYRLWVEPSRLWRRYILGNPVFLFHVARYWLRGRMAQTGRAAGRERAR
jgi:exopolysaccharide biosynthesis WecB/TagA/CpsF family protein